MIKYLVVFIENYFYPVAFLKSKIDDFCYCVNEGDN